jgi:hypothetical protein
MTQDGFEKLIFGSPLLEKLKMAYFDGITQININAPNIKSVQIIGKFEGISLDNSPQYSSPEKTIVLNTFSIEGPVSSREDDTNLLSS